MDSIDLEAIQLRYIGRTKGTVYPTKEQVSDMMKEGIHQALVLASKEAKVKLHHLEKSDLWTCEHLVDKQSILDVEKYIK